MKQNRGITKQFVYANDNYYAKWNFLWTQLRLLFMKAKVVNRSRTVNQSKLIFFLKILNFKDDLKFEVKIYILGDSRAFQVLFT